MSVNVNELSRALERADAAFEKRRRAEHTKLTERNFQSGATVDELSTATNVGKRAKIIANKEPSHPSHRSCQHGDGNEEGAFVRREAILNEREAALDAREVELSRKASQLDKQEQTLREDKLSHDRLISTLNERQSAFDKREAELVVQKLQPLDKRAEEKAEDPSTTEKENRIDGDGEHSSPTAKSTDPPEQETSEATRSATVTEGANSEQTLSQQSVDREQQLVALEGGIDTEDDENCASTRPARTDSFRTTGMLHTQEPQELKSLGQGLPRTTSKRGKRVELYSVGELVNLNGWCSKSYIFTNGYRASTVYRSSVDLTRSTMHDCSIFLGGKFDPEPTFRVVARDQPDDPLDGKSASACWKQVLVRLCSNIEAARAAGENVPPPPSDGNLGAGLFWADGSRSSRRAGSYGSGTDAGVLLEGQATRASGSRARARAYQGRISRGAMC